MSSPSLYSYCFAAESNGEVMAAVSEPKPFWASSRSAAVGLIDRRPTRRAPRRAPLLLDWRVRASRVWVRCEMRGAALLHSNGQWLIESASLRVRPVASAASLPSAV